MNSDAHVVTDLPLEAPPSWTLSFAQVHAILGALAYVLLDISRFSLSEVLHWISVDRHFRILSHFLNLFFLQNIGFCFNILPCMFLLVLSLHYLIMKICIFFSQNRSCFSACFWLSCLLKTRQTRKTKFEKPHKNPPDGNNPLIIFSGIPSRYLFLFV